VPPIFLKTRTYLWTNIFHYGITKPWEQNDRIGKLFLTESLVELFMLDLTKALGILVQKVAVLLCD
jgi:hypothetical protein